MLDHQVLPSFHVFVYSVSVDPSFMSEGALLGQPMQILNVASLICGVGPTWDIAFSHLIISPMFAPFDTCDHRYARLGPPGISNQPLHNITSVFSL